MKFRNPYGPVDIPDLGLVDVGPGDVVEATGDVAWSLVAQGWARVDRPQKKKATKKAAASRADDIENDEEN